MSTLAIKEYTNNEMKIKIKYKQEWTQQLVGRYKVEFYLSIAKAKVRITMLTPNNPNFQPDAQTLPKFVDIDLKKLRAGFPNAQVLGPVPTELSGVAGSKHETIIGNNRGLHLFVIKDRNLYRIDYFAPLNFYDAHLPTVQEMLNSLQIGQQGSDSPWAPR